MVHVPTRGEVPVRLGPGVPITPGYGASTMSRQPYTDPMQFELEREKVLGATWLLAARSSQVAGPGDWISFESHGETVVITRQPDGGAGRVPQRVPPPRPVVRHRVAGVRGHAGSPARTTAGCTTPPARSSACRRRSTSTRSSSRDLRAPAVAVDEWGGWVWVNLAGPDKASSLQEWIGEDITLDLGQYKMDDMVLLEVLEWDVPVSYKAIVDGFNEIYHTAALHHVGPEWTKSAKDTTFHVVNDHNYMCFVPRQQYREQLAEDWDHQRYAICHYVVFPNTVFNCNPEHVQVFQPIPIDVDRTRFLCWELVYPGDDDDPEYVEYRERMLRHWEHLKVVVGEDIDIYQQLARTKRSSAYTTNILSSREFKIAHYHEKMAEMIKD